MQSKAGGGEVAAQAISEMTETQLAQHAPQLPLRVQLLEAQMVVLGRAPRSAPERSWVRGALHTARTTISSASAAGGGA